MPLPGAWRYCRFAGVNCLGTMNTAKKLHSNRGNTGFYPTDKSDMIVFGSHRPFCGDTII